VKIALLQLNYIVADFEGNAQKILAHAFEASRQGVDLLVASELAITGYPPRDLLLDHSFVRKAYSTLEDIAKKFPANMCALLGVPIENKGVGRPLFNAAAFLRNGKVEHFFKKALLPSYDVFDEDRYFEPAVEEEILNFNGVKIGVTICEDIWNDKDFWSRPRYHLDPVAQLVQKGANLVVNLSASPFTLGKQNIREAMLSQMSAKHRVPILYTNQVGGNDELIFDGRSMAFDENGHLFARAKSFEEDCLMIDFALKKDFIAVDDFAPESEAWHALVLGTRDYVKKCGFSKALLGLSGGIDSSLTACIATEALGAENLLGVLMPSPFSSKESIEDALLLAKNLGIKTLQLPIHSIMKSYEEVLKEPFSGLPQDTTEENIQARIRGNLLMALSNKFHAMLLTTGNKSELAVGYCTLYGDMSGGLAVISDLPKVMVYRVAHWLNFYKGRDIIPNSVFLKPPSAELKPNQTDQDTLPPYEILDEILVHLIEQHVSVEELVQECFDKDLVRKIAEMVKRAEFKRKQAAPGLKITDQAFGTGWRMPIARA
jgi:NAD+ synthase (glutamine-hydrolysing)